MTNKRLHIDLSSQTAPLIAGDLRMWCNYSSGGEWQPYPHVNIICNRLQRVFDPSDPLKRLIIEMPPRHGKTFTAAKLAPCWYLAHFPNNEVQVVTHTTPYSEKIGGAAKQVFDTYARQLWGHSVSRESGAKAHWRVKGYHGGINAVGIGGNIIGQGAHLLIIDDPYATLDAAMSPAVRDDVWRKYTGTLRSRLYSNSGIVVIHQRVHEQDLIGRIIQTAKDTGEHWERLTFQAIAEDDEYFDDQLFRRKGEPLCPEMVDLPLLEQHKSTMPRFEWEAYYMQRPIQPEGAFWSSEYFPDDGDVSCFVDQWPDNVDRLVVAVDPSMGKGSKEHDFQAVVALGTCKDGNFYADAWIEKANVNQLCENICNFVQTKLPRTPEVVGVEDEAAQALMLKPLHEKLRERRVWTSTTGIENGKISKPIRVRRLDPWITNHRLRFVRSKGSMRLVEQLKEFPCKQSHDDGPDALEMAFSLLLTTV